MTAPTKFRVAICGGGIGGLTLALALSPYTDVAIDIYEAATRFEEIGAGLGIWGRGVTALRELGLEEEIRAIAGMPLGKMEDTKFELRRSDQSSMGDLFGHLVLSSNLGLHRAQFVNLLANLLSKTKRVKIHFGKRCTTFAQRTETESSDAINKDLEHVTLCFADGTSAVCDVLIGCDGITSTVRRHLTRDATEVPKESDSTRKTPERYSGTRFSGTVAYRALVKPENLRAVAGEHSALSVRKMYCGKDKHIVTYPVAAGRFINFIAYSSDPSRQEDWRNGPWVVEAQYEELHDQYRHFEPEVQALLKCVDKSSRWAMYDLEPLSYWSRGRVTLLGDAAHATTPFIGAGGGQVLEDAYVLSRLLGSPIATRDTLPSVLLAYEQVRRPRANKVILSTREARRAFDFLEEYEASSNEEAAQALHRLTGWLWEGQGEPEDDVREAEKIVQNLK